MNDPAVFPPHHRETVTVTGVDQLLLAYLKITRNIIEQLYYRYGRYGVALRHNVCT
jgi:hypothetical protein